MNMADGSGSDLIHSTPKIEAPLILIVEEDEDSREAFKILFQIKGYEIMETGDGAQAIEMVERKCPNVILMSIGRQDHEGLECIRRMRTHPQLQNVPLIITSAHTTPVFRLGALIAGYDELFVKPVNFDDLYETIAGYTKPTNSS